MPPRTLVEDVAAKQVLLSDGGWGTMLFQQGLPVGACPEGWNLERPDAVLAVAQAYADVGCDLITTNTFGGTRIQLAKHGLADHAAAINEKGASISRQAMGAARHVNASIGPSTEMLMMGTVTEEQLYEAFREQAVALELGGADACLIETMMDLQEAVIAIRAARENTGLEVVCTMTFNRSPDGRYNTMMGITPEAMVEGVVAAGAAVVGTNCSLGPDEMIDLVKALRNAAPAGVPVMVQPNAGQPVHEAGELCYPETPESMAAYVPKFIEAGAGIIGGCCGSNPQHIAAMRKAIDDVIGG